MAGSSRPRSLPNHAPALGISIESTFPLPTPLPLVLRRGRGGVADVAAAAVPAVRALPGRLAQGREEPEHLPHAAPRHRQTHSKGESLRWQGPRLTAWTGRGRGKSGVALGVLRTGCHRQPADTLPPFTQIGDFGSARSAIPEGYHWAEQAPSHEQAPIQLVRQGGGGSLVRQGRGGSLVPSTLALAPFTRRPRHPSCRQAARPGCPPCTHPTRTGRWQQPFRRRTCTCSTSPRRGARDRAPRGRTAGSRRR